MCWCCFERVSDSGNARRFEGVVNKSADPVGIVVVLRGRDGWQLIGHFFSHDIRGSVDEWRSESSPSHRLARRPVPTRGAHEVQSGAGFPMGREFVAEALS